MARKVFCSQTIRKVQGFLGKDSLDSGGISYKIPAHPMMSLVPARSNFLGNLVENGGLGDVYLSPLDKKARPTFVDVADFETVIATYDDADKNREIVIKTSRDIVKGAKKAIYDLHRNLIAEAKEKISEAESAIDSLAPIVEAYPRLMEENIYRGSLEELVEAKCFCHYLETGKLLTFRELNASRVFSVEDYIGGVCDFTGEIGRHAVHCSIARQFDDVIADYHMVDQILGQVAQVTIRNKSGAHDDLRRKFDSIKWTLKKVEQLVYDISFQKTGVVVDE